MGGRKEAEKRERVWGLSEKRKNSGAGENEIPLHPTIFIGPPLESYL